MSREKPRGSCWSSVVLEVPPGTQPGRGGCPKSRSEPPQGLPFPRPPLSPQVQTRNIRCLPDVLVINCEVNSSKEADFWKTQAEVGETLRGRFSRHAGVALPGPAEVFTLLSLSLASLPPPEPRWQRTWCHPLVPVARAVPLESEKTRSPGVAELKGPQESLCLSPSPPRDHGSAGPWVFPLLFPPSPTLISLFFPCSWPGCHPRVPRAGLSPCADACLCFVASIPFRKP